MTAKKIDSLNAENLESRIAPTTFDQPGNSDGHRSKDWQKTPLVVVEPASPTEPSAPAPSDPYNEPIL